MAHSLAKQVRYSVARAISGGFLAVGVLTASEWLLRIASSPTSSTQLTAIYHDAPERNLLNDTTLGYRLRPNGSATYLAGGGATPRAAASYHTNSSGWRNTPATGAETAPASALFFGCSFTFGTGVEDHETLPSQLHTARPDLRGYNFGVPGYGPQQTWALLDSPLLLGGIAAPVKWGIFTLIDDHADRTLPSLSALRTRVNQQLDMPWVTETRDGVHLEGSFLKPHTAAAWGLHFAASLRLLENLGIEITPARTARGSRKLRTVLESIARSFSARFPDAVFVILVFPSSQWAAHELRQQPIKDTVVLDYSEKWGWGDSKYWNPAWGHPNAEAYRKIAESLARDLPLPTQPKNNSAFRRAPTGRIFVGS